MTVLNTSYASIEEAWPDMSGRKKKKKSPPQDPMCDLYEMKGNSSAYSETDLINYAYDKSRNQRTYNPETVTKKASINKDDEVFEVKESKGLPKSLFEKQFEVRHPDNFDMEDPKEYMVRSCKASHTNDETDDVYDDEVVRHKSLRSDYVPQEAPSEHVYDETPAHTPRVSHERRRERFYYTDESEVEDEEPVRPRPKPKPRQRRVFQEEETEAESDYEYRRPPRRQQQKNVYLDIILYLISGIILIFLLEQFVRIGINMQSI